MSELFVPLEEAIPALEKFTEVYSEDLIEVECKVEFDEIVSVLRKVLKCGNISMGVNVVLELLPLSCGHNGVMSQGEEGKLREFLKKVKWI